VKKFAKFRKTKRIVKSAGGMTMSTNENSQAQEILKLNQRIEELEEQVKSLTEEKDMAWFMLDEMQAADIRNMDLSEPINDMITEQMARLHLMHMNKGEA
tara:strand:+ start:487 stop:786 length:300 start_codon:yes stop_codon:yes gene_type:complete